MKFSPFLLPLSVTIAGGIWLAVQTHGIDRLEAREMELKRQAVQAGPRMHGAAAPEAARVKVALPLRKEGGPDWLRVAKGKPADFSEVAPLLAQQLLAMTPAQLLEEYARLKEVADPEWRWQLETQIGEILAAKDPALALEKFRDRTSESGKWSDLLAEALQKVAAGDPAQALRWMDEVAAQGGFSDKMVLGMNSRNTFEASLAGGLLKSRPELVAQRLLALPPKLRANVFDQPQLADVGPELMPAVAGLWKQVLSPEEQEQQLGERIGMGIPGSDRDLGSIDGWLRAASCGPEEKAQRMMSCAENLVNHATQTSAADGEKCLAELSDWALRETPEAAAQVMAPALEAMLGEEDAGKVADFIAQLGGGTAYQDALLAALSTSGRIRVAGMAEDISGRISDAALRESVRKKLKEGGE